MLWRRTTGSKNSSVNLVDGRAKEGKEEKAEEKPVQRPRVALKEHLHYK